MNILQEPEEKSHQLSGLWQMKTIEYRPSEPKSITLLLHGYNERGLRIFRKLKRCLPEDTHIIAPNGPFPLPRVKPDRVDFGYAWYFYNRFTESYHVDQELVVGLLRDLLKKSNPQGLPITIIGFSQGGFLAPLVAFSNPRVKHVIGIGCEFRTRFFPTPPPFSLAAIHGTADQLVPIEHAQVQRDLLKEQSIHVDWHEIPELKHEINGLVTSIIKTLTEQYGKASL